ATAEAKIGAVAVFDPCAARFDRQAQDGVRALLEKAGFSLQPLAYEREDSLCCGWGGQYMITNPRMSRDAAARCAALSEAPYVTYCVNCRDTLRDAGKPTLHVLDILLGLKNKDNEQLTHSRQRENRELLRRLMTGVTTRPTEEEQPAVFLDDALREKISRDWLLEKDVFAAVLYCEKMNRKVYNETTGTFAGHFQQGNKTYWVAYKPEGAGYRLLNAYAHRLKIDES
ncbi:MAG: heterodisulfide reductase-related iron-sulfur binding cluster, partial [Clostridiales bacterium]|nr:heterodisulfide reductase-related iron-sulfur binding cluster [Clostridiales bacterium]